MKRIFTFIKEENRWYVDLPEWEGSKADLEMVCGADEMLETISNGINSVKLLISLNPLEKNDIILTLNDELECHSGAYYKHNINDIWLCDVTKFIFGYFPKIIYIKIV